MTKQTATALEAWLHERGGSADDAIFPNARGGSLSPDGVQYMLANHVAVAQQSCPSLKNKRVSPHVLRHTAAMELLQAGVDRSVIAFWLGHEFPENHTNIFGCQSDPQGESPGENSPTSWKIETLSAR